MIKFTKFIKKKGEKNEINVPSSKRMNNIKSLRQLWKNDQKIRIEYEI